MYSRHLRPPGQKLSISEVQQISFLCSIQPPPIITISPKLLDPSVMSRSAREMTVSRCQKRWNSAMSQLGHMGAHIVERDQRHF